MKNNNSKKVNEFIVAKLKEFRLSSGFTQEDLAKSIGITRTSYINMEAGRQYASADKIYILCCILNRNISDFFPPVELIEMNITVKKVKVYKIKNKKLIKPIKL